MTAIALHNDATAEYKTNLFSISGILMKIKKTWREKSEKIKRANLQNDLYLGNQKP